MQYFAPLPIISNYIKRSCKANPNSMIANVSVIITSHQQTNERKFSTKKLYFIGRLYTIDIKLLGVDAYIRVK